jgi:N-methylhydantoinase A
LGDATTRMRTEAARSFSRLASRTDAAEIAALLRDMRARTRAELREDGLAEIDITSEFEIDVRYAGQAFEVPMAVDLADLETGGLRMVLDRFDAEHRRLFTFNMTNEHEIVNLRAVALGQALDLPAMRLAEGDGTARAAKLRDHKIWIGGALRPAAIYDRAALRAKDRIPGPAIVIEMDSTTLIEHDCAGIVDAVGNILINPA